MVKKTAIVMTVLLVLVASIAVAGEKKSEMKAELKAENATFEGKLVCLGCDLKKAEGARAECSVYGHQHALKTSDGKYVNLLENKYSADLLNGEKYSGKNIKIQGVYYANANQLDVESFTVVDKTMSWCGQCKTMDGCMVGKGDI